MRSPEGVHVIPMEDLVPDCMHAAMKELEKIEAKLVGKIGATQKRSYDDVLELRLLVKDIIAEIKDANFKLNYLHIAIIEAFSNKLKECGLAPWKDDLDRAVVPVYEYISVRQRQEG